MGIVCYQRQRPAVGIVAGKRAKRSRQTLRGRCLAAHLLHDPEVPERSRKQERFHNHETQNGKKKVNAHDLASKQLLVLSGGGSGQAQLSAVTGSQADVLVAFEQNEQR